MTPRDSSEAHRQATWLELFFDLTFVVAVAQAAVQLEHALAEDHVRSGVIGYLVVFAAIWWAWMAFTWFANVFDVDDVPYRLLMFVMIAGALGLAAGVSRIAHFDFRIGVLSYVVMRLAYVAQWVRVLRTGGPAWRSVAVRMIVLTTINQIGWVFFLWVPPDWKLAVFAAWFAIDLATPFLAGWDARTGGHRHHIVERYGLFTIIVLGESIAAATIALGKAMDNVGYETGLLGTAIGGLVIVGSLWWIYFDFSTGGAPSRHRVAQYLWGYLHYFVFAAAAAVGAGLSLTVAWVTDRGHVHLPPWGVALVVGAPVATFLLTLGLIEVLAEAQRMIRHMLWKVAGSLAIVGVSLAAPVISVPGSVLLIGPLLVAMVVLGVREQHQRHIASGSADS